MKCLFSIAILSLFISCGDQEVKESCNYSKETCCLWEKEGCQITYCYKDNSQSIKAWWQAYNKALASGQCE